jgi:predicted amidohydrolase YtcJ
MAVGSRNPIPMINLQIAITRSDGETVLNAGEGLDVHEAIAAFTINGARLFGHEQQLGSIETGKLADLVVLDQNIVQLAESGQPEKIGETRALMTVFNGDIVFERVD